MAGKRSKKRKKAVKSVVARGKRKNSVARATVREGKGVVRINSINLNAIQNRYIRELIYEPLEIAGERANKVDVKVNVYGGGVMGQAQAARTAIAKGLVAYFEDKQLYDKFESVDKWLVVEDPRRIEPKKYKGRKARARFQKSYR